MVLLSDPIFNERIYNYCWATPLGSIIQVMLFFRASLALRDDVRLLKVEASSFNKQNLWIYKQSKKVATNINRQVGSYMITFLQV